MGIRNQIIEIAKTLLGRKYSEMDCSKFCQNVFKPLGLTLPRTSVLQAKFLFDKKMTTRFATSAKLADILPKLKVGDLIFWTKTTCKCGRWNEIHHVGIYAGDGYLYESITSAGKVVYRKVWESSGWQIIFSADVTSLLTDGNIQEGGGEFMITKGMKDPGKNGAVAAWQLTLKALGYDMGTWADKDGKATGIDGDYGSHTEAKTAEMRQKHGLGTGGNVVDGRTLFTGISAVIAKGGDVSGITAQLNAANAKIAAGVKALTA